MDEALAFRVFSQRPGAQPDAGEWLRHAERFLETRLVLESEEGGVVRVTLAPVKLGASHAGGAGSRACWSRPRTEEDLVAARGAAAAGAGLVELAQRCPRVWLVRAETPDDAVALRLAAIVAGVVLGPVLSPGGAALFGPKTARRTLGEA